MRFALILIGAAIFAKDVIAITLDVGDLKSVCATAKIYQENTWTYYDAFKYTGAIGVFVPPYYWWQAGCAFGGLIDYLTICDSKNSSLETLIGTGMFNQRGDNNDYVPANQSLSEGNDDQGVWGMALMQAVERNFTDHESKSWLELTQAVFNTMNNRWDTEHCGGGLRWQIFSWNSGYDYKNSISNGCLFHIAARLGRYTGGKGYFTAAERVWDWMNTAKFFDVVDGTFVIYDGSKIANNCSTFTRIRWLYTYGIFLSGAAYMYNATGDAKWLDRVNLIMDAIPFFFPNGVMSETLCATTNRCNNDQRSFRAIFSRCLGLTSVMIPSIYPKIRPLLEASALGAAKACTGGSDSTSCGQSWTVGKNDGISGLGEEILALEVTMALAAKQGPQILTVETGGTNRSDPNAGINVKDDRNKQLLTISGKDRAGAGIITTMILSLFVGGAAWLMW